MCKIWIEAKAWFEATPRVRVVEWEPQDGLGPVVEALKSVTWSKSADIRAEDRRVIDALFGALSKEDGTLLELTGKKCLSFGVKNNKEVETDS